MRADSHFSIGASHAVCQDYALAGLTAAGRAFAVVSDGCSSSPDTDVGARLAARIAAALIARHGEADGRDVAGMAAWLGTLLALPPGATDATLLVAVEREDDVRVVAWGDGIVAAKGVDGAINWTQIEYDRGAPAYPSYLADPARLERYRRQFDDGARTVACHRNDVLDQEVLLAGTEPHILTFPKDVTEAVAILTDGVAQFEDADGRRIAPDRVLAEMLAFRSLEGRFVERRCRRFLSRFCRDNGWRPVDDVGAAALVRGGTP